MKKTLFIGPAEPEAEWLLFKRSGVRSQSPNLCKFAGKFRVMADGSNRSTVKNIDKWRTHHVK